MCAVLARIGQRTSCAAAVAPAREWSNGTLQRFSKAGSFHLSRAMVR